MNAHCFEGYFDLTMRWYCCCSQNNLDVRVTDQRGVYVEGVTEVVVNSKEELWTLLDRGSERRHVCAQFRKILRLFLYNYLFIIDYEDNMPYVRRSKNPYNLRHPLADIYIIFVLFMYV